MNFDFMAITIKKQIETNWHWGLGIHSVLVFIWYSGCWMPLSNPFIWKYFILLNNVIYLQSLQLNCIIGLIEEMYWILKISVQGDFVMTSDHIKVGQSNTSCSVQSPKKKQQNSMAD